jgi:hypothetical protein
MLIIESKRTGAEFVEQGDEILSQQESSFMITYGDKLVLMFPY